MKSKKILTNTSTQKQPLGYTIIELMVVTGLITILSGIGFVTFSRVLKTRDVETGATLLRNALVDAEIKARSGIKKQLTYDCGAGDPSVPNDPKTMEGWLLKVQNTSTPIRAFNLKLKCSNHSLATNFPASVNNAINDSIKLPPDVKLQSRIGGTISDANVHHLVFLGVSKGVYACPRNLSDIVTVTSSSSGCTSVDSAPYSGRYEFLVTHELDTSLVYSVLVTSNGRVTMKKI